MLKMNIIWRRCVLSSKCRLNKLNLSNQYFDNLVGVYVIWRTNNENKTICVGSGIIRDKLNEMKLNAEVQNFGSDLFVTWADVPTVSLDGVLTFLYEQLKPVVNFVNPGLEPITVNLP